MCSTGHGVSCRRPPGPLRSAADVEEHYCGSFTFREQRNMVENLQQGAQEDATDFMIRVGTSMSNLDKDWRGQLLQAELESLQYEVSLKGVPTGDPARTGF